MGAAQGGAGGETEAQRGPTGRRWLPTSTLCRCAPRRLSGALLSWSYLKHLHAVPGPVGVGDVCHACPCTGIQGTGDTVMADGDAKGTLACPLGVPGPPNTAFSASLWPLFRAHLPQSCAPAGSLAWAVSVMLGALSARPAPCPVSFGCPAGHPVSPGRPTGELFPK